MKIRSSLKLLASILAISVFAIPAQALLIEDDVDNDDSWSTVTPSWSSSADGLTPEAGTSFFTGLPGVNEVRGLYKSFAETFKFGTTYTATFKVGLRDRSPPRVNLAESNAYFFVGSDGTDEDKWITSTRVQIDPAPAAGEWETWTLTTTINSGTTTNDGTFVTEGDNIGFAFFFRGLGDGSTPTSSASFDDLTIVPEPRTYALVLGALLLAFVAVRRARKNR